MSKDRIRTTISIDPDVFEVFKSLASAGGTSVSRAMGDWLADTVEGAQFITNKLITARQAPMLAMRELQGFGLGLSSEVDKMIESFRSDAIGAVARSVTAPNASDSVDPPSSNTGGIFKPKTIKSPKLPKAIKSGRKL
jgi:hypothetical protein